jgi:hypothetical protein
MQQGKLCYFSLRMMLFKLQVNTAVPADNGESKEYHGGTNNREYILDDDECPLAILMNHPSSRGESRLFI